MKYDIYIDGYIGYDVTERYVRQKLQQIGSRPVNVYINSLGGDVSHGLAIMQAFRDHGNVTAYVFGMTASSATIIASGCKEIKMSKYATYLIHQCSGWVDTWGTLNRDQIAEEIKKLSKQSDNLAKVDGIIADIYADRSGRDLKEIGAIMAKGDWMNAKEAQELGLIDTIIEEGEKPAVTNDMLEKIVASGYATPPRGSYIPVDAEAMPDDDGDEQPAPESAAPEEGEQTAGDEQPEVTAEETNTLTGMCNKILRFLHLEKKVLKNETSTNESSSVSSDNQPQIINNMNIKSFLAALGLEAFTAAEDGHYHLTAEQVQALNDKLAEKDAEIQRLKDEAAKKDAQIEALGKEDGATTQHEEGKESPMESPVDSFNELKSLGII